MSSKSTGVAWLAAALLACSQARSTDDGATAGQDGSTDSAMTADGRPGTDSAPGTDVATVDVPSDHSGLDDVAVVPDASDSGSHCGVCATGFSCSPRGYCATPGGVPAFGHVYVIVMENRSLGTIQAATDAPYIHGLMNAYGTATSYVTRRSSAIHPSLPNYIAMTSGDTFGIDCDCSPANPSLTARASCLTSHTGSSCPQAGMHMGDRLDAVAIPWRNYAEGMGTPCNTADSGNYVARHVPFLYYDNVRTDAVRCRERTRDLGDFAADLAAGTYRFSFIAPNLCSDMHGNGILGVLDSCGGSSAINNGDNWLASHVPAIVGSRGFDPEGSDVLFLVWDEEDGSTGSEPIPLIIVSPLVQARVRTSVAYDHYSLLATILDGFGVSRIGNAEATSAAAITDVWR